MEGQGRLSHSSSDDSLADSMKKPLLGVVDSLDLSRLQHANRLLPASPMASSPPAPEAPKTMKVSFMLSPQEVYQYYAHQGGIKAKFSFYKTWVLSMLAGAYIGVSFAVTSAGAGQFSPEFRASQPGVFNIIYGLLFPVGLALVVLCGGELFTSNVCYMVTGAWEGKISMSGFFKNLVISYFGNFAGALCFAGLLMGGEVFLGRESFIITLAHAKVEHPFAVNLCRAILANWLVCLAVWQANAAQDVGGKIMAMWLPIFTFVVLGLEHCIANMFLIPFSMMLGSGISVGTFLGGNLVPVTIGNIIGGAVFCGSAYAFCFGQPFKKVDTAINKATDAAVSKVVGYREVKWADAV